MTNDLRTALEELAKEFATKVGYAPDDEPGFEDGMTWAFRIAHYRMKQLLRES